MSVSETIKAIDASITSLTSNPGALLEPERQQLLAAAKRLQNAVESPVDTIVSITLGTHRGAAVRVAMDMVLFTALLGAEEGGITAKGLGEKTDGDPLLITRLMRFLIPLGFAKELDVDLYVPTPKTGFFATGSPLQASITHLATHSQILVKLADYFRETGYKNPTDTFSGPFQYAFNTKVHYWEWLKTDPVQQAAFNAHMALTRMDRGQHWYEFFPVEERFGNNSPDTPLLIDIGGGLGHDLAEFHSRFPNLPGKLILQDLPAAIEDIKDLSSSIERMKYDFFTPQPVKGARVYYMRTVLHDWPDKQSLEILKNIREAMTKDSVLLLNENFLPEKYVPLFNAEVDLSMMAMFAAEERTEKQWKVLLEEAGLEVVKVWYPSERLDASATLFEAVRKD
ncbi:related to O-methyltransferase [Phialocephala subalpina]|uniref:Related to O-methyltransferase n=1 Tax=Phialocephala subalpina TaxID=576137 RepID=A0A1L7WUA3_9HELO|nr:related to O-methyltransferase [Phialocephala subalpina]